MSRHHTREEGIQATKDLIDMEIALDIPPLEDADETDELPKDHVEENCSCGAEVIEYRGHKIYAHRDKQ